MPVEMIWIVGLLAAGSGILGSAIYSEAKHYRQIFARASAADSRKRMGVE